MNLADLERRVYAHLRDESRSFYETPEVRDWLNDGATDLSARLRNIRREVTGAVESGGYVTLPADFSEEITLRFDTDDAEFVDDLTWNTYSDEAIVTSVTLVRIFGTVIETYPMLETGAPYEMRYIATATAMADDDDEPEIPPLWQVRLTYYALAQAYMKMGDDTSADRWLARYEDRLPSAPTGLERYEPTRVTMVNELGPFDVDIDARHL